VYYISTVMMTTMTPFKMIKRAFLLYHVSSFICTRRRLILSVIAMSRDTACRKLRPGRSLQWSSLRRRSRRIQIIPFTGAFLPSSPSTRVPGNPEESPPTLRGHFSNVTLVLFQRPARPGPILHSISGGACALDLR